MSKLSDWVKENKKEACEECESIDSLRVLREGKTLCRLCYYKHHNKGRVRKVSGKRKERPLTRNSHRDKLWEEIERLRSLTTPETHGQEMRNLQEASK